MIHRGVALSALLGWSLLAPLAWASDGPSFRPATEADLNLPVSASALRMASTEMLAEPRCGDVVPRRTLVDLSWDAGASAAPGAALTQMRVDISKLPEGFASGRFETTGAFAADRRAVTVPEAEPGVRYYWRVLAADAEGWGSSDVRRFRAPVCKADVLEADQIEAQGLSLSAGGQ
ncbi:MAG: hypothetical protein AAGM22_07045 [Acidobacteriota bacterium]